MVIEHLQQSSAKTVCGLDLPGVVTVSDGGPISGGWSVTTCQDCLRILNQQAQAIRRNNEHSL